MIVELLSLYVKKILGTGVSWKGNSKFDKREFFASGKRFCTMIDGIWKFKRGGKKDSRVYNLKVVGYMALRSLVYLSHNRNKS